MKISLIKILSILVASERSDQCNKFIDSLREKTLTIDHKTGKSKAWLLKFGAVEPEYLEDAERIAEEVYRIAEPRLSGINSHYFDGSKNGIKN